MMYVQWVAAAVVMISVLVVIHEFGHFLAAKAFGVGTRVFSFGMGPRLIGVRLWDTDFRISALPIGGYVQMAGADPFGEEDPDTWVAPDEDFMRKPVWQRLVIMFAGPAMNLALPPLLFTLVLMGGEPKLRSEVQTLFPGSVAEHLGLEVGDRLTAVNGEPVDVWDDVQAALEERIGQPAQLTVRRGGSPDRVVEVPGTALRLSSDGTLDLYALGLSPFARSSLIGVVDPASPAAKAGLRSGDLVVKVDGETVQTWEQLEAALDPAREHAVSRLRLEGEDTVSADVTLRPDPTWSKPAWATLADGWGLEHPSVVIGGVNPKSAAADAGLQAGDRIVSIDDTDVDSWDDVLLLVAATARENAEPRELKLDVVRDGERISKTFQPKWDQSTVRYGVIRYRPLLGIAPYPGIQIPLTTVQKWYSFPEAARRSAALTSEASQTLVRMVWNMVTVQTKPTDSLGGPVAIVREAGEAAQRGIFSYVRTMALISLSLGVINLVPFPLLDGGQIVFYAIEGIRGRPLPVAIRDRIQMVGILALMALFLVVTVNDVSRWIG